MHVALAMVVVIFAVAGLARAGEAPRIGAYAVEVRLELPHVASAAASKTETVCLSGYRDLVYSLAEPARRRPNPPSIALSRLQPGAS